MSKSEEYKNKVGHLIEEFKKEEITHDTVSKLLRSLNIEDEEEKEYIFIEFINQAKKKLKKVIITNETMFKQIRNECNLLISNISNKNNKEIITEFLEEFLYKKRLNYVKKENKDSEYNIILYFGNIYKVISNSNKDRIYGAEMSDELIKKIENLDKNKDFVSITAGYPETGKSWGEEYDRKGRIGFSSGLKYSSPLLIGFLRGEYDEEKDITIGKDYDFLNNKTNNQIADYLEENNLNIEDVIDYGGMIIDSNIVGIKSGKNLKSLKTVYTVDNFQSNKDWNNIEIKEKKIFLKTTKTDENGSILEEEKEEEQIKYELSINDGDEQDNSYNITFETLDDLMDYINVKRENDLMSIKNKDWFLKIIAKNKKQKIKNKKEENENNFIVN